MDAGYNETCTCRVNIAKCKFLSKKWEDIKVLLFFLYILQNLWILYTGYVMGEGWISLHYGSEQGKPVYQNNKSEHATSSINNWRLETRSVCSYITSNTSNKARGTRRYLVVHELLWNSTDYWISISRDTRMQITLQKMTLDPQPVLLN